MPCVSRKVLALKLNWGDLGMLEKEEVAEKAQQVPKTYTLHIAAYTLNSTPYTLHPHAQTDADRQDRRARRDPGVPLSGG